MFHLRALMLPVPVSEYRFEPTRRWRFDLSFPDHKLAVEIEGIVYPRKGQGYGVGGRHGSVKGFRNDIEKYGRAAELGWIVVRVLPEHITSGEAARWVEGAFKHRLTRPPSS